MTEWDKEDQGQSMISIKISDILGLGKAAEKLSPAALKVAEGLGKIVDPTLSAARIYLETRARSTAERQETKKNLQLVSEVDKILASEPRLAEAMKARLISTEMRRQANIHAASSRALEIANSLNAENETVDLDEDFVQEWVEGVKDISSQQVQEIWATLLASSPQLPDGRVSKPALELLKQFDQPTAACFMEFLKVWAAVGFPSVKVSSNWAPFGTPLRLKLLSELGIIEDFTAKQITMPDLGRITQTGRDRLINTMDILVLGQRALELGEAIFIKPIQIDDDLVHAARVENFRHLANDSHWSLGISGLDETDDQFQYTIGPVKETGHSVEAAMAALAADPTLDQSWKKILTEYAEAGRLILPKPAE